MANPKRRVSQARRRAKRQHQNLRPVALVRCSNCGTNIRPHTICYSCGHYRTKQVMLGDSV